MRRYISLIKYLKICFWGFYGGPNCIKKRSLSGNRWASTTSGFTRRASPFREERNPPLVTGPDYNKKIEATIIRPADLKKTIGGKRQDLVVVDEKQWLNIFNRHIHGE